MPSGTWGILSLVGRCRDRSWYVGSPCFPVYIPKLGCAGEKALLPTRLLRQLSSGWLWIERWSDVG